MSGLFEVWAPLADELAFEELDAGESTVLMRRDLTRTPNGEWTGIWVADRWPVGRYWLLLDGDRLADPRATEQPDGFDGPSLRPRQRQFAWTDDGWTGFDLGEAVVYEVHVGTFAGGAGSGSGSGTGSVALAGTFDGIIEHLDHLIDLGIDAIELMPINTFPGDLGWGYDGVALWAPHPAYGGADGLDRLVDACHRRGLGVLLDVVYNHLGPLGNNLHRFGPYFTDASTTPWGAAVNLDGPGSDDVRTFIVDNAVAWVRDHHLDGLRLDAVGWLQDHSATHIIEDIAAAVHREAASTGRRIWVVAESDLNDPRLVRPPEGGGFGVDAAWSDDFHHTLHAALTGESDSYYCDFGGAGAPMPGIAGLAKSLTDVFVFDGRYSAFRKRRHGRPVGDLNRHCFLGFAQNHDQVGNRPLGERLAHLVGDDAARVAAAIVMTAPFVPMLFQGEEWGASTPFQYFTSHPDPDLASSVSEGRRAEHGDFATAADVPDPQEIATFKRSCLRWDEVAAPDHQRMLEWHRQLIALRRNVADLRCGDAVSTEVVASEHDRWLHIRRGRHVVVANLGDATTVPAVVAEAEQILLRSDDGIHRAVAGWVMPAMSVVVAGPSDEGCSPSTIGPMVSHSRVGPAASPM